MENLYESKSVQKNVDKVVNPSLKNTLIDMNSRVIIDGGTGAGKTHTLMTFIEESPLTFQHIVIINMGIPEPLYETLRQKLEPKGQVTFFNVKDYPRVQELSDSIENKKDQYLIVFDDIVSSLKNKKAIEQLEEYFMIGRKCNMTSFLLTQNFFSIPKSIRTQASHLFILKLGSDRDLKLILSDFTLGISREQLAQIYRIATTGKFNFLKVDTLGTDESKKFTRNFTDEFVIEKAIDRKGEEKAVVLAGPWIHTVGQEPPKRKRQRDVSDSESDEESESEKDVDDIPIIKPKRVKFHK